MKLRIFTKTRRFWVFIPLYILTAFILGTAFLQPFRSTVFGNILSATQVSVIETPASNEELTGVDASDTIIKGHPVRIIFPSVNVDVEIRDGIFNALDKTWTLSDIHAHYALVTPPVNSHGGNTFIYGHSIRDVFGSLHKLKSNDSAIISTREGHTFNYRMRSRRDVSPSDVSVFTYSGDEPILTVQTCSGTWYEKRRLFEFELVHVEEKS